MSSSGLHPPQTWSLGGQPIVSIDVPITSVFLLLYICGASAMMSIFVLNQRKGHKFLISEMLFGFCMARIVTTTLRIASTCLPHDLQLALAAQIFVAAGVLLLFIANLVFAQRILRATHPRIGWNPFISTLFPVLYALVVITIAMLITSVVQTSYTVDPHTLSIDRAIMLYGTTCFAIVSILPLPVLLLVHVLPRKRSLDKFGEGRHRTKVTVLLLATLVISSGAWWRAGTSWVTPVPTERPLPWYFKRVWFYIFNFGVEVAVVGLYAVMRVDKRFHVPNGAKGNYTYGLQEKTGRGEDVASEGSTLV